MNGKKLFIRINILRKKKLFPYKQKIRVKIGFFQFFLHRWLSMKYWFTGPQGHNNIDATQERMRTRRPSQLRESSNEMGEKTDTIRS